MPIACSSDRRCASASMAAPLECRQIRIERGEDLIDRRSECADARFDVDVAGGFFGAVGLLEHRLALVLVNAQSQRNGDDEPAIALDSLVTHDLTVDAQRRR